MRTDPEKLKYVIGYGARILQPSIPWANAVALLGALAEVESSFGVHNQARFERAYNYGGSLCNVDQKEKLYQWGAWAACSYSSFQIMYPTACELGFDVKPWLRSPGDLFDDEVAIHFVLRYIQRRIIDRGAKTVREFGDAYNSGNHRDHIVPIEYMNKFDYHYAGVLARRGLS